MISNQNTFSQTLRLEKRIPLGMLEPDDDADKEEEHAELEEEQSDEEDQPFLNTVGRVTLKRSTSEDPPFSQNVTCSPGTIQENAPITN